jgi:DNA-directed RNA polymerase specialized sigma24 family protein
MYSASADPAATDMGFHTTHWTLVLTARSGEEAAAGKALAGLCAAYWSPLYAFIRRQGASPEDAQDLTQEFFRHFLAGHPLDKVQRGAGKFRSFLLACLKNFLANQRERARAQRRGGGCPVLSLDSSEVETHCALGLADHLTPEALFDRRWAFTVLDRALAELRREYGTEEKRRQFEDLQGFLPCGQGCASRAELAAKRGVSVGAIDVAVHRLRQRFGALLRQQIAQTVSSEAEVEEELRYLISVLGA